MRGPVKVLSVDDHPLVRDGIAFALKTQEGMQLVAEATNGQEAIELFETCQPDVTLMDLQMPVMGGLEAMMHIRQRHPAARFIVLTTYSGDVLASRALKAGAAAYLLKGMLRKELIETIHSVHAGHRRIPGEIASALAENVASQALSQRELEVLRYVSHGCSNKVVASELAVSEDTIKSHMRSILGKLQANDRTHAVMIAMKRGFLDG